MKIRPSMPSMSGSDLGYVALEFALAMGMLVLPTALVLLQVPTFLEQHDRVSSIATTVAQSCANDVSDVSEGQRIANEVSRREMDASSSLGNSTLVLATCDYESSSMSPGSVVTSNISVDVPAAVIPGLEGQVSWTMSAQHDVRIPKYRSFEEP